MIPPCGFVFGGHLKHTQDFSSVQSFSFVRNLFYVIVLAGTGLIG